MTVTVRSLLELEDAHLILCAGAENVDNVVRWVHVSEMLDPTPWMQGGEFVLTTGFRLTGDDVVPPYLDRLAAHGVAGIGFSTGDYLGMHATVPSALLAGAAERGIPLLEVPIDTPWVLISEYVSRRIAEEQNQLAQRAFDAQRDLTRVALDSQGHARVVTTLATLIDGWAMLTTPMGRVIAASHPSSDDRLTDLELDLARVRETGSVASVSGPRGAVGLHPLGGPHSLRQLLIVGKAEAFDAFDRIVTASAVSLLSFASEQRLRLTGQQAAAAEVLGTTLLSATSTATQRAGAAAGLGIGPRTSIQVIAITTSRDDVAEVAHDVFSPHEVPTISIRDRAAPDRHIVILQTAEPVTDDLTALASRLGEDTRVGASETNLLIDLEKARRQATVALDHASPSAPISRFAELSTFDVVLGIARPDAAASVSRTVLAPFDSFAAEKEEMLRTARAFLQANGRWEPAARMLGIHRQTLVKRIAAIEARLGESFDSADLRMSLWFALQERETRFD